MWIYVQGIRAGKFPCWGSFQRNFPVVPLKTSFPENSNKMLSNKAPSRKLLSKNTSSEKKFRWGTFWRICVETSSKQPLLWETCYVGALLRGKLPVLKLLSGSCKIIQILPGRRFLIRKQNTKKHDHPKMRSCSFRFLLQT